MHGFDGMGKLLIIAGVFLVMLGLLIMLGAKLGVGRLPGDIFIQKGNFRFYFPLVTSILLSILLSAILSFIYRR